MPASDGAGVRLNRSIGTPDLSELDPFLLLDEFDSAEASDYIAGFPDHPHRGFETVTYMIEGRLRHEDNAGNAGTLRSGGVQWMTAGRGIIHSEMPQQEEGRMQGFQLWVNLPARLKMTDPRYQDIDPERVPEVRHEGEATVRVVAGTHGPERGPVTDVFVQPLFLDIRLEPSGHIEQPLPEGHTAFVYVFEGAAAVDDTVLKQRTLGVLGPGSAVRLRGDATEGARLLLVAGAPIGEPVARYGPFVMNSREELIQAFRDFESGRF